MSRATRWIKLVQKDKTVSEYEAEFARLAKFAPTYVSTEENRVRRFEEELKPAIKRGVVPFELKTYKDVVNKALLVKSGLIEV